MSETWYLAFYAFKNAWLGMKRHLALCLSSIFTVFLAMSLIAFFSILGLHVNAFSVGTARDMTVHVILEEDLTDSAQQVLYEQILALDNVEKAELSTKDEELELMIAEKGDSFAVYRGEDNPLSDAYFVTLKDEQKIADTAAEIAVLSGVADTAYGGSSVSALVKILNGIRWASFGLVVLLLMMALYLIYNTIRTTIYSRQSEIAIMWTVGATPSFIRVPFEIEGVLIGLIGALVPFLIIWLGYPRLYESLDGYFFLHSFSLIAPARMIHMMAWTLFGFGALCGGLASFLSATKYIGSKTIKGKGTKG